VVEKKLRNGGKMFKKSEKEKNGENLKFSQNFQKTVKIH
jgi:hypothetical protein